jgi:hypothetical protein
MKFCKINGCKNKVSYKNEFCKQHKKKELYIKDKDYREKRKEIGRFYSNLYYHRKKEQDPEWNARRQREYRATHKKHFNYIMARCYFKKLTTEKRRQLIAEFAK